MALYAREDGNQVPCLQQSLEFLIHEGLMNTPSRGRILLGRTVRWPPNENSIQQLRSQKGGQLGRQWHFMKILTYSQTGKDLKPNRSSMAHLQNL